MEASREPTVICKPALDHREYCHLRLGPRGELTAVLISDPETDKAAAAMDVGVGHSSDPASLPGLAHFCEHMLFLGTDKYPEEGSYQAFVSEHGGACNAFTGYENTNYHFDVNPAALPEALDRFAQFFVAPRFTESATRRELHAVDAEHAKNAQGDAWRLMQLLKSCAAPGHPFAKFGTGNLATLRDGAEGGGTERGIDLREALRAFHATHYHATAMRLVILGRESLGELQAMCARFFGDTPLQPPAVPLSDAASAVAAAAGPSAAHGTPYGAAELRRGVQAVPVGEQRTLTLTWPLPPLRPLWRSSCMPEGLPLAVPELDSCASLRTRLGRSGRIWIWGASATTRERGRPTERPATASEMLEIASSKVADCTAFDPPGANRTGWWVIYWGTRGQGRCSLCSRPRAGPMGCVPARVTMPTPASASSK